MSPIPRLSAAPWVYAIRVSASASHHIPFFDFAAAFPSRQPVQLLVFAGTQAKSIATPLIERTGFRLLPIDVPTMRRFGWQPEYARLLRNPSDHLVHGVILRAWIESCCELLTEKVTAWIRLFVRMPQVYCCMTTHDFTAMMAPFGVTYMITLCKSEGVYVEIVDTPAAGGAVDEIAETILEIASERLEFALALLRRSFKEHAVVHARAALVKRRNF